MQTKKELLLIDGRNYCYRHAHTRTMLSSKGRATGAIFGALSGLIRLHRLFPDAAIVFCWDGNKTGESWRNKLEPLYKANRKTKPGAEIPKAVIDIRIQIPIIEKLVNKLGFRNFKVPKLEADDLIGVLATELSPMYHKVIIYSTDKDYFQLVKNNIVVVRDQDKKRDCQEITKKEMKKQYGVLPKHWLHFRSLTGDSSDNIKKPIVGVGPKKAMQLLAAGLDPSQEVPYKDDKVDYKEQWPKVRVAYQLSKIVRSAKDKRLPAIAKVNISRIVDDAKTSKLTRTKQGKSKKTYKYLIDFLSDYDLLDIQERRFLLWNIP